MEKLLAKGNQQLIDHVFLETIEFHKNQINYKKRTEYKSNEYSTKYSNRSMKIKSYQVWKYN